MPCENYGSISSNGHAVKECVEALNVERRAHRPHSRDTAEKSPLRSHRCNFFVHFVAYNFGLDRAIH